MPTPAAPRDQPATTVGLGGAILGGAVLAALVVCVISAWREGSLVVPRNGGHPIGDTLWSWVFLACLSAAFVAYTGAAVLAARGRIALRVALAIGIAVQAAPLAAPLLLSTDAWTYWDYGRIAAVHGANPYVQTPRMFPDDPAYVNVGARWVDTPSVYGPLFTLATAPLARVTGASPEAAAWTYKALAALAMMAAMLGASRVARHPALAAVVVGWNPSLAVQAAGAGHNDAWIAALVIGALVAARARRPMFAGAAWAFAALVKWIPMLLVPPIAVAAFKRVRAGRESMHTIVGAGIGFAVAATIGVAIAFARYGTSWLGAFATISRNARTASGYSFTSRLGQVGFPPDIARIVPLVVVALVGIQVLRAAWRGHSRIGLATVALVACSPLISPWYLLWVIPLSTTDEESAVPIAIALGLSGSMITHGIPLR